VNEVYLTKRKYRFRSSRQ